MKIKIVVSVFLGLVTLVGCESQPVDVKNETRPHKTTLFRASDQSDSSQGSALPTEPIVKDPSLSYKNGKGVGYLPPRTQQQSRQDLPRGVSPQTTPAMESNDHAF